MKYTLKEAQKELLDSLQKMVSLEENCRSEVINQWIHRRRKGIEIMKYTWEEAQKELLEELITKCETCCGAGEYCDGDENYGITEDSKSIHIKDLKDKLRALNKNYTK